MEFTGKTQIPFGAKGHYRISTRNTVTGELVKDKCFDINNVVTTEGKHYFFSQATIRSNGNSTNFSSLKIGFATGTAEVLVTDTTLGGTSNLRGTSGRSHPVFEHTDKVRTVTSTIERVSVYPPGTVTGTYGQVGLHNSNNVLLAGQVLRDSSDNPTTVTFLDIEEVTVNYVVELTYTYGVRDMTKADMTPAGTTTVDIGGAIHTVSFLAFPAWVSCFSNDNVLNNSVYDFSTIFLRASNDDPYIRCLTAESPDALEGEWSYLSKQNNNDTTTLEVLEKGSRYKVSDVFTIPYTMMQDLYIKEFALLGVHTNTSNIMNNFRSVTGVMQIDPPIFKGAGFELTVGMHMIYELV